MAGRLPWCRPGDAVALGGAALADAAARKIGECYRSRGARPVALTDAGCAEVVLLAGPTPDELRAAVRMLNPGGVIAVAGPVGDDARLAAPDCVLSELTVTWWERDAT
jgi:threonine dehydrogenase-like Zn-dependent dehydrogenase